MGSFSSNGVHSNPKAHGFPSNYVVVSCGVIRRVVGHRLNGGSLGQSVADLGSGHQQIRARKPYADTCCVVPHLLADLRLHQYSTIKLSDCMAGIAQLVKACGC